MRQILALDAGGTNTRAVVLDSTGRCLGYGRTGGGNPVTEGADAAVSSLATAARLALDDRDDDSPVSSAVIAMAGTISTNVDESVRSRFAGLGIPGEIAVESDLLGVFHSGTVADDGYALIAGTGAVAARVAGGRLEEISGGNGWLLGDAGSGFWIGHRVVRAAVADLDRLGPHTELTDLVLASLALERSGERITGRERVLLRLIDELYALRPVELSRFAPLAFRARSDAVAGQILSEAASALAETLDAVRVDDVPGPVVLGGSILGNGMLAASSPVAEEFRTRLGPAELIPVVDGLAGAAVMGLRRSGVEVDEGVFERITAGIAGLRDRPRHAAAV